MHICTFKRSKNKLHLSVFSPRVQVSGDSYSLFVLIYRFQNFHGEPILLLF